MNLQIAVPAASVTAICLVFGISRAAYYAAGKRVERAARPKQPTPEGLPSVEHLKERIRALTDANRAWGFRKVWATLRFVEGLRVGRRRVHALMKSMNLLFPARPEHEDPRRGHVAVPEPNRRWATDFTCVNTSEDGLVYVFPVIDCGCRTWLDDEVTTSPHVGASLRPLERALDAAFGRPENVPHGFELRTDQGSVYTSATFRNVTRAWRIDHTFTPVARPTGNAVVERVIRTLKEECLWLRDWRNAAEIRTAVAEWRRRYNEQRPHQALGWSTPAQRRAARLPKTAQKEAA